MSLFEAVQEIIKRFDFDEQVENPYRRGGSSPDRIKRQTEYFDQVEDRLAEIEARLSELERLARETAEAAENDGEPPGEGR